MMKLLLTSHGWDENPKIAKAFKALVGKPTSYINVFVITTARKKDSAWKYVISTIRSLKKIGILRKNIVVFSLDRKIRGDALKNIDIVYACGGNTFLYLKRMRKTGLDKRIKKFMREGGTYYGVSAGSIIAGPDISLAEPFDDNDVVGLRNMEGLELTKIVIAPHYQGKAKKIIDKIRHSSKYRIVPLNDRQALEIIGEKERMIK